MSRARPDRIVLESDLMIKTSKEIEKTNRILIAAAVVLTAILQLSLIFNYNVWNDEATTIIYVLRDWKGLFATILEDDHPPFYYFSLKALISMFGYHFRMVKLYSALPLILMHVWMGALLLKDERMRANRASGALFVLFCLVTTCETQFMYLSTEIRMYGWAMAFVTLCGVYGLKILKDLRESGSVLKDAVFFVLFGLLSAYTHYFAALSAAFVYLFLFFGILLSGGRVSAKKKTALIIGVLAGTILGYAPWLPMLYHQFSIVSNESGSRLQFKFAEIGKYFDFIVTADLFPVILLSGILLLSGYRLITGPGRTSAGKTVEADAEEKTVPERLEILSAYAFISVVYLLMLTGILVNLFVKPVFMSRYLTPALGLFWLGFVILLDHVDYRKAVTALFGAFVLYLSFGGYLSRLTTEYDTGTKKIVSYFNESAQPSDYIVTNNEHLRISVLGFYFPGHRICDIDDVDFENDEIDRAVWFFEDTTVPEYPKERIDEAGYQCMPVTGGDFDNTYYFRLYLIGRKPEPEAPRQGGRK